MLKMSNLMISGEWVLRKYIAKNVQSAYYALKRVSKGGI